MKSYLRKTRLATSFLPLAALSFMALFPLTVKDAESSSCGPKLTVKRWIASSPNDRARGVEVTWEKKKDFGYYLERSFDGKSWKRILYFSSESAGWFRYRYGRKKVVLLRIVEIPNT